MKKILIIISIFSIIINNSNAFEITKKISAKKLAQNTSQEYIKIDKRKKLIFNEPPIDISTKANRYSTPIIDEVFILKLNNAEIYYDNKYTNIGIIVNDDTLLYDTIWDWSPIRKKNKKFIIDDKINTKNFDKKILYIAQEGSNNYYHWTMEVIPKILLIKDNNIKYDLIFTGDLNNNFQIESLDLLKINSSKIIKVKHNTISKIKSPEIIIPSRVSSSTWTPKPIIDRLRKEMINNALLENTKQYNERIFISRKKARYRKIINEDELFDELKKYNFERYYLEDLKLVEQIALFNQAKIIIGPHGAGMTNIIYTKPKTTVIEIFQEHEDWTFYFLSQLVDSNYIPIKTVKFKSNGGYNNTSVNVDHIIKHIKSAINNNDYL